MAARLAGDPLDLFSPAVAGWFRSAWPGPTPPQAQGWPVIARGDHALVVSPTGSGKTLTAFLWSIDRLFRELDQRAAIEASSPGPRPRGPDPSDGIRVVYVSPLKALNNDVERNLQVPLAGIRHQGEAMGVALPEIRVAVRTGDTPSAERQKMLRRPPHILITTPESLYLMLTSERARNLFATTHTVIVDEIHTLIGTKRGAHLALSLERLNRLTGPGLQRIGLSATVRPLENAAHFLAGQDPASSGVARPVTAIDASYPKKLDLRVVSPVADFREKPGDSIWPAIIPQVARLIDEHRTTLIFCNNRRLAERTADRLNEHRLRQANEAAGLGGVANRTGPDDLGIFAAGVDARELEARGLPVIRAHHGSVSKPARLALEQDLKSGKLPALVCTSSLELGIDIGEIDLVIQLQSPKSVAAGLQRVGRSGHLVGQTSVGRIFATHVEDVLEAAAVCRGMKRGEIEHTETPENPLDILAQQLVAMVSVEDWSFADAFDLVRGAYPFRNLTESVFRSVVEMLSGKYPESVSRMLKANISWDRVNDRLAALPGANVLAIGSGGTIPDRGTYALVLADRRTRVGELDEEFVYETRPGDTFLLGSHVWRVTEITDDRVMAEPAPGEVPRMPFWRGDAPWRPYDLGRRIGAFRREVTELIRELTPEELEWVRGRPLSPCPSPTREEGGRTPFPPRGGGAGGEGASLHRLLHLLEIDCGLDPNAVAVVVDYIARQIEAGGEVASDRTVIAETFVDAIGEPRLVLHSPFGGRVNGPWGIALAGAIRERLGVEAPVISGDDGILIRFANADLAPPIDLIRQLTSQEARERLLAELPGSATFGAQFRMNAARALLLPRERAGKRTPLWLSRLRAKDLMQAVQRFDDFPITLETYRDCLRDVLDLPGLTDVLDQIQRGEIELAVEESDLPSPVAAGLEYRFSMQYMYEYDAPRGERQLAALNLNRGLLAELLRDGSLAELLKPEAIADVAARAARTGPNDRVRDREELAQLLFEFGDLSDAEVEARSGSAPSSGVEALAEPSPDGSAKASTPRGTPRGSDAASWLAELAEAGRIIRRQFGAAARWVHRERLTEYERLADDPTPVLRRYLVHAGPTRLEDLAQRYVLSDEATRAALDLLGGEVVAGHLIPGQGEEWIDRRNLELIHRKTLSLLRQEVQPVPLAAYSSFLLGWQGVGTDRPADVTGGGTTADRGPAEELATSARLRQVIQQLRGLAIPGVSWERDVLPARVPGFEPSALAELAQAGEVMWVAEGGKDPRRSRVSFFFRGEGGLFLDRKPDPEVFVDRSEAARAIYDFLQEEGAALLADVADGTGLSRVDAQAGLVELVVSGLVTNDSLDALRAVLGYEPPPEARERPVSALEAQLADLRPERAHRPSRQRLQDARRRAREVVLARVAARRTPWVGRWSLVHRPSLLGRPLADDERAARQARQLLARWGIVTRAALEREAPTLSWESLYRVLAQFELRGEVRRGYFVAGLPGIQFARPDAVELLRASNAARVDLRDRPRAQDSAGTSTVVVVSAADPAQLFGGDAFGGPLRFARVPTSAVALWAGEPVAVAEDSGAAILAVDDSRVLIPALRLLAAWWKVRGTGRLTVERWNGEPVFETNGGAVLEVAGFVREYRGMTWLA
jgi:ATP-dependent Lhr-like helicase